MNSTEFLALLDELFELDAGTITTADVLKDIKGWSSLTFIGLIAMIDEECGVCVPPKSILACNTVGDLMAILGDQIQDKRAA